MRNGWKIRAAAALCVAAIGCGGANDVREDETLTKEEAARQLGELAKSDRGIEQRPQVDVCAERGWYGDGVCDDFCAGDDPDCEPTETFCGGIAGIACPDGQYCRLDACGVADGGGVCVPQPEVCIEIFLPVCGCDGQTYGNACKAAAAGATVDSDGECLSGNCPDPADPAVHYVGGSDTDPTVCAKIRFSCEEGQTLFSDECGCGCVDEGSTETACGGWLGETCEPDEYCEFGAIDTHTCDYADASGVCTARPEACIQVFDPVCGCNGRTYGNECAANAAGTDAIASGECP